MQHFLAHDMIASAKYSTTPLKPGFIFFVLDLFIFAFQIWAVSSDYWGKRLEKTNSNDKKNHLLRCSRCCRRQDQDLASGHQSIGRWPASTDRSRWPAPRKIRMKTCFGGRSNSNHSYLHIIYYIYIHYTRHLIKVGACCCILRSSPGFRVSFILRHARPIDPFTKPAGAASLSHGVIWSSVWRKPLPHTWFWTLMVHRLQRLWGLLPEAFRENALQEMAWYSVFYCILHLVGG